MTREEFLKLLAVLEDEQLSVGECIEMTDPDGAPCFDDDGEQVINDVVQVGDGRLYIQRDGNEPESEQMVIDLLRSIDDFLPAICNALRAYWQ